MYLDLAEGFERLEQPESAEKVRDIRRRILKGLELESVGDVFLWTKDGKRAKSVPIEELKNGWEMIHDTDEAWEIFQQTLAIEDSIYKEFDVLDFWERILRDLPEKDLETFCGATFQGDRMTIRYIGGRRFLPRSHSVKRDPRHPDFIWQSFPVNSTKAVSNMLKKEQWTGLGDNRYATLATYPNGSRCRIEIEISETWSADLTKDVHSTPHLYPPPDRQWRAGSKGA